MDKEVLSAQINGLKMTILEENEELALLKEKLDALKEFSGMCGEHTDSFGSSIYRRKGKLSSIDSLDERVKSVKEYRQAMGDMLTGYDYSNTVNSIEYINTSVSNLITATIEEIEETKKRIIELNAYLTQLQSEYEN